MKIQTWLASSLIAAILAVGPAWAAEQQACCGKKEAACKENKDKQCEKQKQCDKQKECPKGKEAGSPKK